MPPDASHEEIKRAYRRKIAKAHPDREGGDKSKALAVNEAWRVLGDQRLRDQYDTMGEVETEDAQRNRVTGEMINLFMQIAESSDVLHEDLMGKLRSLILANKQQNLQAIQQLQGRIKRYEIVAKRIRTKKRTASRREMLFVHAANSIAEECRKSLRLVELKIEEKNTMLQILDDFSYDFEARVFAATTTTGSATSFFRSDLLKP